MMLRDQLDHPNGKGSAEGQHGLRHLRVAAGPEMLGFRAWFQGVFRTLSNTPRSIMSTDSSLKAPASGLGQEKLDSKTRGGSTNGEMASQ